MGDTITNPEAGDVVPQIPIDSAAKRYRQRQLLSYIGAPGDESVPRPAEVVNRVIVDLHRDVASQTELWGPLCDDILKRAIPYDTANPLKPAIMPELMPSAGDSLAGEVWEHLQTAFLTTFQATPIVLALGTSGMGKTKCAYDIGMQHAFVVITRIVEHSVFTPPWQAFLNLTQEIVRSSRSDVSGLPLSERMSVKSAIIVLMVAHLEWAVAVSEEARKHPRFNQHTNGTPLSHMREIILRAQRNSLAYQYITYYFRRAMKDIIINSVDDDGRVDFNVAQINQYYCAVAQRASACWSFDGYGTSPRIVFAYDEAQVLLDEGCVPTDICDGASTESVPSPHTTLPRGLFYELLAAMRDMQTIVATGHLILGNSMDLCDYLIDKHSPAQRSCKIIDRVVSLNVTEIRAYLTNYLTPEAMRGVTDHQLHDLAGRPLFASRIWAELLVSLKGLPKGSPLDSLMTQVLTDTVIAAAGEARFRIRALWDRHTPILHPGPKVERIPRAPHHLLIRLFHDIVMSHGQPGHFNDMQEALKEAIQRGVLNARKGDLSIWLDAEPITKAAIHAVGMELLRSGQDIVMSFLASRMTGPAGDKIADQGPALADCFAWDLVRRCLLAGDTSLTVAQLLGPHLARASTTTTIRGEVDLQLLPSCREWRVKLSRGMRCDTPRFETECPLALLVEASTNDVLLHHTTDKMAGPDIIFTATDDAGIRRLVILQLQNHTDSTLTTALESLNMGFWHPTSPEARASLRYQLATHPSWAQPIRVVVAARPVDASALHAITYFNLTQLQTTPILLVQPTAASWAWKLSWAPPQAHIYPATCQRACGHLRCRGTLTIANFDCRLPRQRTHTRGGQRSISSCRMEQTRGPWKHVRRRS